LVLVNHFVNDKDIGYTVHQKLEVVIEFLYGRETAKNFLNDCKRFYGEPSKKRYRQGRRQKNFQDWGGQRKKDRKLAKKTEK